MFAEKIWLKEIRYGNKEPKRSEANQKISKKARSEASRRSTNQFYFDAKLRSALFTYFLIRLASLRLIISVHSVAK